MNIRLVITALKSFCTAVAAVRLIGLALLLLARVGEHIITDRINIQGSNSPLRGNC